MLEVSTVQEGMMEDRISALKSDFERFKVQLHQLAWKIEEVDKKIPEEPLMDTQEEVYNLRGKLFQVETELSSLRIRISEFEDMFSSYMKPVQTYPDTNIISPSLWKRMWAVFGHGLIGNVILALWIVAITVILFRGT